jgi:hypothetical protein
MADFSTASVLQAYDGELFCAPFGTAIPPDIATALDPAFISTGWITEDGLTFSPNLSADDPIKGWPRGEILLRPAATQEPEFGFSLAQHDSDTLTWLTDSGRSLSLVLDYRASVTSDTHRLVLPKVKLSEAGEIAFNVSDLISVELTVGCERDDESGYTYAFMIPDATGTGTIVKSY